MPNFEVCIVVKEYRWLDIEAENEAKAKDKAYALLDADYFENNPAQDSDIEIYADETKENTNA